jgi:hypothetical protein
MSENRNMWVIHVIFSVIITIASVVLIHTGVLWVIQTFYPTKRLTFPELEIIDIKPPIIEDVQPQTPLVSQEPLPIFERVLPKLEEPTREVGEKLRSIPEAAPEEDSESDNEE